MRVLTHCEAKLGVRCATWPKCCTYYYREQVQGKRRWVAIRKSEGTTPKRAEELAVAQRLGERQIELGLKAKPKEALPLLSVYIARYEAVDEVKTQATFETKLKPNLASFLAHVKDRPVNDVTADHLEAWRQHLLTLPSKKTGGTLSRNTAQRMFNSVRGFFAFVAEKEKKQGVTNPVDDLAAVVIKQNPAPRVLWQPDQLWLIEQLPPRFKLPLKIGRLCGCRRTEALTLTKHDLSPKGQFTRGPAGEKLGWIAVQRLKKGGGKGKERVPIALSLVDELRAQLKTPFQQHVFGDPPPEPNCWSSQLTRKLRALGKAHDVDVRGLCMHGTRHTATTYMQDTPGVSTKATQAMGGWTSSRMVETYSQPTDAAMLAAAEGLARSYKAGLKSKQKKRA